MPVTLERKNKKKRTIETKVYETVAERLLKFREKYPIGTNWSLNTEISHSDNLVHCKASIVSPSGHIVATGHAEENRKGSIINQTSAVENCETSAIGRCLSTAGFGGGEFCSADELLIAIKKQEELISAAKSSNQIPAERPLPRENGNYKAAIDKNNPLDDSQLPKLQGVSYERQGNTIIATGKTFSVKGLLGNAGFKWTPKLNAWALCLS